MSYNAIIYRLKNQRPHPKAEKLQIFVLSGIPVITSIEHQVGELGILFLDDGYLSQKMVWENNLSSNPELNKDQITRGYFGKNRRIKAQNFRGEKSAGFWLPLECVNWTGVNLSELKEGDQFTHLNGKEVCGKYINPITIRISQQAKKGNSAATIRKAAYAQLKEHFDTEQLAYNDRNISVNSILYITSKCHGTSARTGNIHASLPLSPIRRWWNKYFGWTQLKFSLKEADVIVSGTRRVILDPEINEDHGYYSGKKFRIQIHQKFKDLEIPKGYCIYYEIVGYDETTHSIMPSHQIVGIQDKKLRKQVQKLYGDRIYYSYGCTPNPEKPEDCYKILVYRVTFSNSDKTIFELSWPQVTSFCQNFGLKTVPLLEGPIVFNGDSESLLKKVETYLDIPDPLDASHPIEGICLRVESEKGLKIYKQKSYIFRVLEGIVKEDPTLIDVEELEELRKEESNDKSSY